MATLINQVICDESQKGLGLSKCIVKEGRPTGYIITTLDWELDLTTDTYNKTLQNTFIQSRLHVPVLGAINFTNNTPEPTTEEYQSGIKDEIRKGLPEMMFTFNKGWKWQNNLVSYDGFQEYKVLLVFNSGAIAGVESNGKLKGFTIGMHSTGAYMFTDGSTGSKVNSTFQIINEQEFFSQVALIDRSKLGFNINTDIQPVTDIDVKVESAASAGNLVTFSTSFNTNNAEKLGGLDSTKIRVIVNGVQRSVTGGSVVQNTVSKIYTAVTATPVFAANDKIVVELYDTTNSLNVAMVGQRHYSGVSPEFTVV